MDYDFKKISELLGQLANEFEALSYDAKSWEAQLNDLQMKLAKERAFKEDLINAIAKHLD